MSGGLGLPNPADVVATEDLSVAYEGQRRLLSTGSPRPAVRGVSLRCARGETLGIVGESGAGKSSVGRALLGLVPVTGGAVTVEGRRFTSMSSGDRKWIRRRVQIVYQDPYSSLNPSMVAADIVGEVLRVNFGLKGNERRSRVRELFEQVGLSSYHLERYPYEFSGGQRQRIAIARALALEPSAIVCDEAVSALDVSTQAQIINLLEHLQDAIGVGYLMIAHDLAVVRHMSHRIAVMFAGRIVEEGPAERVYSQPTHPYTQELLAAVPIPDPVEQRRRRAARRKLLGTAATESAAIGSEQGCPFRGRCPYAMEVCSIEPPPWVAVDGGGASACHLDDRTAALS